MLVLEEFDDLIFLLSDKGLMPLEIVRETEIVGCTERWDTREGDLTCDLSQASDETIEGVIDTSVGELRIMRLLRFEKYLRHGLHEIVDEYSQSSRGRESASTIVWLEEETHLLEGHHIVAYSGTRYLEIMPTEERLGSGDLSRLDISFDDVFEDLDLPLLDFFHVEYWIRGLFLLFTHFLYFHTRPLVSYDFYLISGRYIII
jgi:hypothetical protein